MSGPVRMTALGEILTDEQLDTCCRIVLEFPRGSGAVDEIERLVTRPSLAEIDKRLGQANDSRYLAFVIEFALRQALSRGLWSGLREQGEG